MAAGDFTVFNKFAENLADGIHNLSSNTIKIGLIASTTPLQTASDPRWAAGGSPDFSAVQATPGGNYASGGPDLTTSIGDPWSLSGAVGTFDLDDVSIAVNASNPSTVTWGIIYDDTATNKNCIGFVEIDTGGADLTAGNFTITWHASGLFTLTN